MLSEKRVQHRRFACSSAPHKCDQKLVCEQSPLARLEALNYFADDVVSTNPGPGLNLRLAAK